MKYQNTSNNKIGFVLASTTFAKAVPTQRVASILGRPRLSNAIWVTASRDWIGAVYRGSWVLNQTLPLVKNEYAAIRTIAIMMRLVGKDPTFMARWRLYHQCVCLQPQRPLSTSLNMPCNPTPERHRLMRGLLLHCRFLLCLLLSLAALCTPASAAQQRVALVIGNASYTEKPLRNPVNDAELMQRTLKDQGFDVTLLRDVDRRGMLGGLRDFEAKARNAEVALFFFAGHGTQVSGANYLIPLQAQIRAESDVPDEAVDAASVLRRIEDAKARVGLVILDACRDNPYAGATRSSSRGLARMSVPTGSIVAYATAPGDTADDGRGANGVYTEQLVRHLSQGGLDLREVFDRTATEVERITNGKQKPREDIGLRGRFVLKAGPGIQTASLSAEPTGRSPQGDPEEDAWQATKAANTVGGYDAYLSEYFNGRYAAAARVARAAFQAAPMQQSAPAQTAQQRPSSGSGFGAGQAFKDCADCPEMLVISAGSFQMGSTTGDADEKPVHGVNINSFAMGKTEVTRGQFAAFVAASGHSAGNSCWTFTGDKFADTPDRNWRNAGFAQTDSDPVACVNWDDAQAYALWLAQKTGKSYRLPSEAEWEYACRAGSNQTYCGSDNADSVSVYGRKNGDRTLPVAGKQANAWGLHDMSGNLWEWTQDCWNETYNGAPSDGSAWTTGNCGLRSLRGGSWYNFATFTRAAIRGRDVTSNRVNFSGFRLTRMLP